MLVALNNGSADGDALGACSDGVGGVFDVCADHDVERAGGRIGSRAEEQGGADAELGVGALEGLVLHVFERADLKVAAVRHCSFGKVG